MTAIANARASVTLVNIVILSSGRSQNQLLRTRSRNAAFIPALLRREILARTLHRIAWNKRRTNPVFSQNATWCGERP
jgi:hypothetical protein